MIGPVVGLIAVGCWLAVAGPWGSEESQKIAKRASEAQRKRDYASAQVLYQEGYAYNLKVRDRHAALWFLQGIGGSQLGLYKFRAALASFVEAKRISLELNDTTNLGAASGNLASLYLQTNDLTSARQTAQQALDFLKRSPQATYRVQLLYVLAEVALRQGQPEEAFFYYRQGIDEADSAPEQDNRDHMTMVGLDRLALALLHAGYVNEAEHAVLEVYRFRYLHKDRDIVYCYPILAEIELRRGNLDQAKVLGKRGIEFAQRDPRGLPLHEFRKILAQVLERRAEYREAHVAFLAALYTARQWRLDLLPADNARTAGESSLAPLYDAALQNAAHLQFEQHQDMATEAWLQAEDWRASSLRRRLAEGQEWLTHVPAEYWETLAEFRKVDASTMRTPTSEGLGRLERLRVRLAEMESFAGVDHIIAPQPENFPSGKALTLYRRSLQEGQALISFQLGERVSHRWILGSNGLSWTRLPPRTEIADLSGRFRDAVESGSTSARALGAELGKMLFGNLNREAEQAKSWVLVLDGALFQVPFAALLLADGAGAERYLIEKRSLTSLPGAWSLASKPVGEWKGDFVGVADAVYNSADPRWGPQASEVPYRPVSAASLLRLVGQTPQPMQLPRLAASRQEVQVSASTWNGKFPPLILTGMEANLRSFHRALERRPSVVHFAVHVIANQNAPDRAYIALSLASDGVPELLSTSDVAHLKLDDALVVLSGCHSAIGAVIRGSGSIGLVRAWMMSGAAAVVASLWPTPDESGAIFESFYRELRRDSGQPGRSPVQSAAEALRRAQLEMLRTNSWRAQPKYWATFQITGRTS